MPHNIMGGLTGWWLEVDDLKLDCLDLNPNANIYQVYTLDINNLTHTLIIIIAA